LKFYTGHSHVRRGKVLITAVATLETKYPAQKENERSSSLSSASSKSSNGSADDGEEQVDDREKLRRMRISKANRGNTPWNKGRKHSPETLQKIRERTKIAMQDPKIKMKLANLGHAQKSVPVFRLLLNLLELLVFVIIILSSQICMIFTARRHG
jgi:hypothetical protein